MVQNFVKAYGAKYKDDKGQPKIPDNPGLLAYDATNLLLQAIKEAGVDDTAKVKDALTKISFRGVSGQITFDKDHNPKVGHYSGHQERKVVFYLVRKSGTIASDRHPR